MSDKDLVVTNVRIRRATKEWLHREAEKQDRSMNWIVNQLLDQAVQKSQESARG